MSLCLSHYGPQRASLLKSPSCYTLKSIIAFTLLLLMAKHCWGTKASCFLGYMELF